MSAKAGRGIVILMSGLLIMTLKCVLLYKLGARSPHIPEPEET